jgi:hypothetical protein
MRRPPSPVRRLVLEDHHFYQYLPSVVGAAAVGASRYVLQMRPVWPDSLVVRPQRPASQARIVLLVLVRAHGPSYYRA